MLLSLRRGLVLGVGIAVGLSGVACGSAQAPATSPGASSPSASSPSTPQAPGAPVYGGTFKMTSYELVHLDPHRTQRDEYVHGLTYDTLVTFKDQTDYNEFIVVPSLAEKWDISSDGLTYTFTLRQGVKFHNGDVMTADDVVYSLERFRADDAEASKAYYLDAVDTITKVDEKTVKLSLKEPSAPLLNYLAMPYPAIVSQKFVEANQGSLKQAVNGTGPFKFTSYERGGKYIASRNPDFWGKDEQGNQLPFLDRVEYIVMPDYAARTAAFRARESDLHDWYRGPDVPNIPQSNPDSIQLKWTGLYGSAFAINHARKPFDDVRVRQALFLAMDRRAMAKSNNVIGPGYLSPPVPASVGKKWARPYDNDQIEKDLPNYKRDIARAKELLAEAGVSDLKVTATFRRDLLNEVTIMEIFKDNLKEIGVDLQINAVETGASLRALVTKDFDIVGSPRGLPIADPDDALYGSFFTGASQNYAGVSIKELDDLILKQRQSLNDTERLQYIREIEKLLADQAVWLFTTDADYASSWQPWVKNFKRTLATHVMIRKAWINKN